MTADPLTVLHVVVSLVGILSGGAVVFGLLGATDLARWVALFLTTTAATSVSGFLFPFDHFLPSHAIGLLSLLVLAVALFARYQRHLVGRWRQAYVVAAVGALYLNVFVLIVQGFLHVPALTAMAPTQSELPFLASQLLALVAFVALGAASVGRARQMALPIDWRPAPQHPGSVRSV